MSLTGGAGKPGGGMAGESNGTCRGLALLLQKLGLVTELCRVPEGTRALRRLQPGALCRVPVAIPQGQGVV